MSEGGGGIGISSSAVIVIIGLPTPESLEKHEGKQETKTADQKWKDNNKTAYNKDIEHIDV